MDPGSSLPVVLAEVRSRIARAASRKLNEQNTKATLIEPVLRALGWDVEDVEEVQREFKVKRRDKPVDYGLLVVRNPRLFIEAKGLGENLDDRRWVNQIMGYAGVAGVEWIVLTDGNEYRIYNSHAPVTVEEKMFRSVRISDGDSLAEETLGLLAKDRIAENRIAVLWRAHFVDRQVRAALEQLFSAESDLLLVNHIAKQAKNLSPEEIRASLGRCQVQLDFPLVDQQLLQDETRRSRKDTTRAAGTRSPAQISVSVLDLIQAGLLRPPVSLECHYKGRDLHAEIQPDGSVLFEGKKYHSLSTAAGMARATIIGHKPGRNFPQTNGWTFWKCRGSSGSLVEVDSARQEFLTTRQPAGHPARKRNVRP